MKAFIINQQIEALRKRRATLKQMASCNAINEKISQITASMKTLHGWLLAANLLT